MLGSGDEPSNVAFPLSTQTHIICNMYLAPTKSLPPIVAMKPPREASTGFVCLEGIRNAGGARFSPSHIGLPSHALELRAICSVTVPCI